MKKNEKDEKLTLCLRYICKMCPRARKCEQELREESKKGWDRNEDHKSKFR